MLGLSSKQRFKRLQHTLMAAFLVLSITPLTIIALFFLKSHSQDLQNQSTSHLISVRDNKQQQAADYMASKETEVLGFVRSELALASGGRWYGLVNAFSTMGIPIEESRRYYQTRYIQGSGDQVKTSVMPDSPLFNGTERYRLLHKRYHRGYMELLKLSDFDDILLIDIDGNVTYSAFKYEYFGTNLLEGPFKDNNLGQTFVSLKNDVSTGRENNPDYTPILLSDFSDYDGQSYAWYGAPIIEQGYLHSYAMFRLPINGLTKLLAENRTENMKLLVVGEDNTARTLAHSQDDINQSSQVVQKALSGSTDFGNYTNSKGEKMIAAYTPIEFKYFKWGLVVEMPEAVAFASVIQLQTVFVFAMLCAIVVVVVSSHYLSNFITSPLLKLTWAAEKVSAGDLDATINNTERRDEIGRLAVSFERMQRSIRDKIELIKEQNRELEESLLTIQKQNDELQLANKLKDEFLATTSHELRTPLHGMVGIAEALISGANGPISGHQKYQLDIIISSGQRLANLVDDLLDYHKMRYGSLDIHTCPVDMTTSTQLVLELSNHLLGDKPIRIINQVSEEPVWVIADPQRLEQVLYNLVGNAIKYTSEGKIVISAGVVDDHVRVQVVDTGQGIPADQLEHIFEPLIQAGREGSQYRQGAGLGLSISRQLIELMGGSLYVSSQPMVGTTFSFTLPIATAEQIESVEVTQTAHFEISESVELLDNSEEPVIPENPDAPLLLIADDEPVNVKILDSFLRLSGYRVRTAKDGHEAISQIEKEKPELLLLDIMMPGMSGYEVCEKLRKDYDHSQLPIIMLTALSQSEDRIRGFEAGANDYLTKPFNKQELAARITAHLQASQAEKRRFENQKLQAELKRRAMVEASLLETQGRLLEQLESAPEAIICIREDHKIRFANEAAARFFKRTQEQLKRSQADEVIAPKFLNVSNEHYCGDIEVFVEDMRQRVSADILSLPEESGLKSIYILSIGGSLSAARINNLETAIEVLSGYAFDGDKARLQQLKEMGGEFTRLADKVSGESKSKQDIMREVLVDAMTSALNYWERVTGKTKFEFAEQSGLWRVYLDRSTLQTRTLDKYLRIETLPKTPRWRTVLNSLDYILEHCIDQSSERNNVEELRDKLQRLLTSQ